jgi:hypothetical protein
MAAAVVVSRHQFQRLRRIRTREDVGRLREYVRWARRPVEAAFTGTEVTADVSEYDLILLRVPAEKVEAEAPVFRDAMGWAVIDPGIREWAGRVRLQVQVREGAAREPVGVVVQKLPGRRPPHVSGAVRASGTIVEIYGEDLEGVGGVRVESRGGEARVLYRSARQINVDVRSVDEVRVVADGIGSDWVRVEGARR